MINTFELSVSGFVNAFTIVGVNARPSANMLKSIAILPTRVVSQRKIPRIDKVPQIISNLLIFHSAFLLTKDPIRIRKGTNPIIKVVRDWMPTPCFISAKKAIKGAIVHKVQLTLFGLVFHLTVSIKYPIPPIN